MKSAAPLLKEKLPITFDAQTTNVGAILPAPLGPRPTGHGLLGGLRLRPDGSRLDQLSPEIGNLAILRGQLGAVDHRQRIAGTVNPVLDDRVADEDIDLPLAHQFGGQMTGACQVGSHRGLHAIELLGVVNQAAPNRVGLGLRPIEQARVEVLDCFILLDREIGHVRPGGIDDRDLLLGDLRDRDLSQVLEGNHRLLPVLIVGLSRRLCGLSASGGQDPDRDDQGTKQSLVHVHVNPSLGILGWVALLKSIYSTIYVDLSQPLRKRSTNQLIL